MEDYLVPAAVNRIVLTMFSALRWSVTIRTAGSHEVDYCTDNQ